MSETFVKNMLILAAILLVAGLIQKILIEPKSHVEDKPRNGANGMYTVKNGGGIGCQQEESYDRLTTIAVSGDKEAYKNLLYPFILSGECVKFAENDKFNLEKSGFSMVRIRLKGKTTSYWTKKEIIF